MIVAHRGAALEYPENTLQALDVAVAAGARWVEVDVQLHRGIPVLSHDPPTGGETPLAEFAGWLARRPDVTALVDFKSESLREFGRPRVVDAVVGTMWGAWHPISFDYPVLQLAVAAGCRAPGWCVCNARPETLEAASALGARWLIMNQIFLPEALPTGPWEWMVYEIENRDQAENAIRRGARWLETMRTELMGGLRGD